MAEDKEKTEESTEEGADEASEAAAAKGANVDDIARRVAALGEEDELDKISRAEEEKLAERRKKKGKKGGLETAASKRLQGIGKRDVKRPVSTATGQAGDDPLLSQTKKLSGWARQNQKQVSIAGAAVVVAALAAFGWMYMERKAEMTASVEYARAVSDELGGIGDPDKDADDDMKPKDARPMFKTAQLRRESALKKYQAVRAAHPKSGAAILSRLAEGSILLDTRDADGAAGAFKDVKASPLATADAEVRGRALEGLGFAYELKAEKDPKALDDALKAFVELEQSVDVKGFKELAMYHQARVHQAKGDNDKAKELLKNVRERVTKPSENHPFPYLEEVATDRLRQLDPQAVPPKNAGALGGPGGNKMSEAQIRQLLEKMKAGQHGGGGGHEGH